MPPTRIRRLHFRDHQQFRDLDLDFVGPDGKPLSRICFIGRNGTGKTTILKLLSGIVREGYRGLALPHNVVVEVDLEDEPGLLEKGYRFPVQASKHLVGSPKSMDRERPVVDLDVVWPAESATNSTMALEFAPGSSLEGAMMLREASPSTEVRLDNPAADVWNRLMFLSHQRERARQEFENRPESLEKTKRQLIEEFDATHPIVLEGLVALWDRLLGPAGLRVDLEGIRQPVAMKDNLELRVVTRTGQPVPYGALSTGLRTFLFRVGLVYLLCFDRKVENGFAFVDEPENSLFPDVLFELMELLDGILGPGTQLFVATHSPLVAAQFEPCERFVLDFDDQGDVTARRGTAPKGDDPNDLLTQDFGLVDVMGFEGRKKYREYQELRKRMRRATEPEKTELLEQAAEIGRAYGFD